MKIFLSFLFVLMLGPGLFLMDGAILKDLRLKSETLSPANIPTTDRKCRSKLYLFQGCSYDYVINREDHDQSYFFVSLGPPETLVLLRGDKSGELTSDVGQDYLWNRILTVLFFPALAIWCLFKILLNARQQSPSRSQQRPIVLQQAAPSAANRATGRTTFGKRR